MSKEADKDHPIPPSRRFRYRLFHLWFLLRRPMTLGVRIAVFNEAGEVLLVRHTYTPGWYLPGGGVERGETVEMAARKELLEETMIEAAGLRIFGVYANRKASKRDHVVLFTCASWRSAGPFKPNREIREIGFFPIDALPQGTTPSTIARLQELAEGKTDSFVW